MTKAWFILAVALSLPVCGYAQGPKSCDELKAEIAKKLDANNVKSYSLDIVPKDQDAPGKVVGTCEAGSKKIMYSKMDAASDTPAKDSSKP
jgi:hypothetical protein